MADRRSNLGRVVASHQPNFFPWLGYFDKVAHCDAFVSLDHVQLPGGSGSWVNRVKLLVGREPRWVTAPVLRRRLNQAIAETEFDERVPWRRKLLGTLQASYRKAAHFEQALALLEPLIRHPAHRVADYNLNAMIGISASLGIDTVKILRSSTLCPIGSSNDLLVDLTRKAGGDAYMHGSGAESYRDDDPFVKAGLLACDQDFVHPVYPQEGAEAFTPGLSIIDVLMNLGVQQTGILLAGGRGR